MRFVDRVRILVRAGDGGDGHVGWRREKYVPRGGPAGGDGGRGGDVILVADEGLTTLLDLRYRQHYRAKDGRPGRNKCQYGAGGDDLVVRVPVGTAVYLEGLGEPGERPPWAQGRDSKADSGGLEMVYVFDDEFDDEFEDDLEDVLAAGGDDDLAGEQASDENAAQSSENAAQSGETGETAAQSGENTTQSGEQATQSDEQATQSDETAAQASDETAAQSGEQAAQSGEQAQSGETAAQSGEQTQSGETAAQSGENATQSGEQAQSLSRDEAAARSLIRSAKDRSDAPCAGGTFAKTETETETVDIPAEFGLVARAVAGGGSLEDAKPEQESHSERRRRARDEATLLGDLVDAGQELRVAQGGRGGRGNVHFRSSTNRTPTHAEPGIQGEGFWLRLELKLLADVGIVGFPNVGKSTLISRISRARPKVGAYPFTTLVPQLGVVGLPGERSMVVADVPGLIKGASEGRGLGLDFLRHLERTRVLLHLLAPDPGEGRSPLADLDALEAELRAYGSMFDGRPRVVALNKIDTPEGQAQVRKLRRRLRARRIPVFPISAATGEGISALLEALWRRVALSRDLAAKKAASAAV